MELLTPGIGLLFWQLVVFVSLFILLAVFAWKPIVGALRTREAMIEDALRAAEVAKEEMAQIKADNEYLMQEARIERDQMLKDALAVANQIKEEAKQSTAKITDKMIEDAKSSIESEKKAALSEVKALVATLSLDIAEKLIREKLSDDKTQLALVDKFLKSVKVN